MAMLNASARSGDAADGPTPPQPLGAEGLLRAAAGESAKKRAAPAEHEADAAQCKRPDATPASIFSAAC